MGLGHGHPGSPAGTWKAQSEIEAQKESITIPIFAASILRLKSQFRGSLRDILDQEEPFLFPRGSCLGDGLRRSSDGPVGIVRPGCDPPRDKCWLGKGRFTNVLPPPSSVSGCEQPHKSTFPPCLPAKLSPCCPNDAEVMPPGFCSPFRSPLWPLPGPARTAARPPGVALRTARCV